MRYVVKSASPRPDGLCIACGTRPARYPFVMAQRMRREPTTATPRIYCCRTHAKRANEIRSGKRDGRLHDREGVCPFCTAPVDQFSDPKPQPRLCGELGCWRKAASARGYAAFEARVKWPQELPWLAKKLKLPSDDPRLPGLALRLAALGKLVVFVRSDGTVGEIGLPNERRSQDEICRKRAKRNVREWRESVEVPSDVEVTA